MQPPHPQHRGSLPTLVPVNTAAVPPAISQQRRPSAPAQLITGHPAGLVQSPLSASPINKFSGMSLAGSSPATPVSSRPGTSNGHVPILPRSASSSRPPSRPSSRPATSPPHPAIPPQSSSSSVAGAFNDLTSEDDPETATRKKRKLEHASAPVVGPAGAAFASQPGTAGHMSPPQADIPSQPTTAPIANSHIATHVVAPELTPVGPSLQQSQPDTSTPAQDVARADEATEEPEEEQTTIEEDCLEANFEEEADETKKWCRMCRFVSGFRVPQ